MATVRTEETTVVNRLFHVATAKSPTVQARTKFPKSSDVGTPQGSSRMARVSLNAWATIHTRAAMLITTTIHSSATPIPRRMLRSPRSAGLTPRPGRRRTGVKGASSLSWLMTFPLELDGVAAHGATQQDNQDGDQRQGQHGRGRCSPVGRR